MISLFTKIINREIPADIVYEDNDVISFNDINPQAPIHILVVPKKEIRTLNDVSDDDKEFIGKIFIIAFPLAFLPARGRRQVFSL